MTLRVLQLVTTRSSFFSKQVEALERQGVSVTTVTVPSAAGDRSVADYLRFYATTLREALGSHDVVHANYGLTGPFALAQPRRPVVLTLWGSEVMGAADWAEQVSEWSADRADAVVAPSAPVAEAIDAESRIVPFPVDTDLFHPMSQAEARDAVGWDRDATIALFPYSPDREVKNYPLAQRVVESASMPVELRTVDGVPYERMPLYMNASDVVLVTSSRESGPMVVKEAAACGVPVVATDVGFVADVLADRPDCRVCDSTATLVAGLESVLAGEQIPASPLDVPTLQTMGDRLIEVYETARNTDDRSSR
jgi:glycosyltransferase involved in cell wall biosynthesis